jgi:hypothetical protein
LNFERSVLNLQRAMKSKEKRERERDTHTHTHTQKEKGMGEVGWAKAAPGKKLKWGAIWVIGESLGRPENNSGIGQPRLLWAVYKVKWTCWFGNVGVGNLGIPSKGTWTWQLGKGNMEFAK